MFRRITAAASRLLTADGADGSFYSLESLNARVRSMAPTHPALVLLWCQILLLVSHTDYRWWAEVQQTPKYVPVPLGGARASLRLEVWSGLGLRGDPAASEPPSHGPAVGLACGPAGLRTGAAVHARSVGTLVGIARLVARSCHPVSLLLGSCPQIGSRARRCNV